MLLAKPPEYIWRRQNPPSTSAFPALLFRALALCVSAATPNMASSGPEVLRQEGLDKTAIAKALGLKLDNDGQAKPLPQGKARAVQVCVTCCMRPQRSEGHLSNPKYLR